MVANEYGQIVSRCWDDLPNHYPNVRLDAFVVMPDHVHGIVQILPPVTPDRTAPSASVRPIAAGQTAAGSTADGDTVDGCTVYGRTVETGLRPVSTEPAERAPVTGAMPIMRTSSAIGDLGTGRTVPNSVDHTQHPGGNRARHGLSEVVRAFKAFSARRINEVRGTPGQAVWQPRFYDRIVRGPQELFRIRRYIRDNPLNWSAGAGHDGGAAQGPALILR